MTKYDNMVGEFGLDDVQEIGQDLIEAKEAFLYVVLTCFVVMALYSVMIFYLTGLLVWISIIATGVGVLLLSLLLNQYV